MDHESAIEWRLVYTHLLIYIDINLLQVCAHVSMNVPVYVCVLQVPVL